MTNAQTSTLVFKDQAGEYYLVPQETLEQCRVPEEHKTEIEHLIAEQQDVQGYLIPRKAGGEQQEYILLPPPLPTPPMEDLLEVAKSIRVMGVIPSPMPPFR